jgi:hypothetical protein
VLDELQRRSYSPATTRGYILAIKQFADYLPLRSIFPSANRIEGALIASPRPTIPLQLLCSAVVASALPEVP